MNSYLFSLPYRDVLASVTETENGPRVGKYFVNLTGCRFAADPLKNALINSDVIICDEVGPMELKSNEFINTIKYLLKTASIDKRSKKPHKSKIGSYRK